MGLVALSQRSPRYIDTAGDCPRDTTGMKFVLAEHVKDEICRGADGDVPGGAHGLLKFG